MKQKLGFFLLVLLLLGCSERSFLFIGDSSENQSLQELMRHLDTAELPETRYTLLEQIIPYYQEHQAWDQVIFLLTDHVGNYPEDPFNGLYLFQVAEAYRLQGAPQLSVGYYERIVNNHIDLEYRGDSIHFMALRNLVFQEDNPHLRLGYFKDLMGRFQDKIDKGLIHYYMARTYEELGLWDLALQSIGSFLSYPGTSVRGDPNAHQRLKIKLDFHNSDKSWVNQDLEDLMADITWGLNRRNWNTLDRLRNQANFFGQTWQYRDAEGESEVEGNFINFMRSTLANSVSYRGYTSISVAAEVDQELSNEGEAYLRTSGWYGRAPVRYLYFRRIDYPQDPELHKAWEWAGVFLGEKL